ncbi:hydrogenase small subunit [Brevibacillus ginsengisoli]|uniref:hydrogenase small subunit n=1 Tax=Brevibacillus ginsengisoli TaxID=363854 RepID=UPI003CEB0470
MDKSIETFAIDRGVQLESTVKAWAEKFGFDIDQVRSAMKKPRTPMLWLNALDCTGCIESFLRAAGPGAADLFMNWVSLEYSELLSAASGEHAEHNKASVLEKYKGEYVLVVEGAIPTRDEFLMVAGRSVREEIMEAAKGAKAVFAYGSCSAWGGIPAAKPNPTESVSLTELIPDIPVVLVPGCPPIADVMVGTLLHLLIHDTVPELDKKGRPKMFYECTVHQVCHRRHFFDEGLFAETYDDEGAKKGYCLFKLGCKGPSTFNACESMGWNDVQCSPIGAGSSCIGCSEKNFWDKGPLCSRKVKAKAEPAKV